MRGHALEAAAGQNGPHTVFRRSLILGQGLGDAAHGGHGQFPGLLIKAADFHGRVHVVADKSSGGQGVHGGDMLGEFLKRPVTIAGQPGSGQGSFGNIDGLVSQALQVDDRPGIADDAAQIQGHRLLQGQQFEAGIVDVAGLLIDDPIRFNDLFGHAEIATKISGHGPLTGVLDQAAQGGDTTLEGLQLGVKMRSGFHKMRSRRLAFDSVGVVSRFCADDA